MNSNSTMLFPSLDGWGKTKATLHAYSKVVGSIPRAHAIPHPKWWHISLKVQPDGLVTDTMSLPGGGIFQLKMDFLAHAVILTTSRGQIQSWSMTSGLSANQLAAQVFDAVTSLGLKGNYAREKFESDEPQEYSPFEAENYFSALVNINQIFARHRISLTGDVGPIQLWPHGFDLSFEWFGTRKVEHEEHGTVTSFPSQINLGFSPGESNHPKPYFYSNPFPFENEKLTRHSLPHSGRWFTESWKGSLLEYSSLVNEPQASQKLTEYARAVYEIASPTLLV